MTNIDIKVEPEIDTTNDKTLLLDNEKSKDEKGGKRNGNVFKNSTIVFLTGFVIILSIYCISLRSENNNLLNKLNKHSSNKLSVIINELDGKNIFNNDTLK